MPTAQRSGKKHATTPDPIREDGVGRDVLQERAEVLLRSVARQSNVTPELLAAHRPGGADNPDTSAMGWLSYLCQLHRWHATGPAQPENKRAGRWDAQAIEDLRDAMAAQPIQLRLEDGREVAVYPKGDYALGRIVAGQVALQWATEHRVLLLNLQSEGQTLSAREILSLRQAVEFESALTREFVWILTHPGADVPWDDDTTWDHELPDWTRGVTSFDLIAIRRAHLEVNLMRINAIAARTDAIVNGSEAMPLQAFLGVMAADLHIPPREFARRWSLGEIIASNMAKHEATERAHAQARREAEHG